MADPLLDFLQFLSKSPTVFHASREISNRLAEADFTPLKEGERWKLCERKRESQRVREGERGIE